MKNTVLAHLKFGVERFLIPLLVITVFVCFIDYMKIETRTFNNIVDSRVYLPYFPDRFFTVPFSGKVRIEKRNFNGSVRVTGKCDSMNSINLWLEEQGNSLSGDILDYLSTTVHANFDLPYIRLQDKNNEPINFKMTLDINNGEIFVRIELYYPQRR
ncbi:hypothetical protein FACS1894189_6360 [Planctomycetales bacterium]|nr:hypothetical protein FACS1894189_6360 [Planctomycetales bacterium]